MSIQQITNYDKNTIKYDYKEGKKVKEEAVQRNDMAVVYEREQIENKVYQKDQATIDRLLEEAKSSSQKLKDLVEKMLLKQGKTLSNANDIYSLLREGKVEVDDETRAQAKKDIAEDGYWGVVQTSERLVSFAKALSGGDPSKADLMIKAVKKGFEQAEKAWGGKLPSLCKDTVNRTISKLEEWRDSINETEDNLRENNK